MKNKNLYASINSFNGALSFDSESDLGYKSRHYIDSLLPIYRTNQTKLLKGLWKLKELHYNPSPGSFCDYIKFEDSVIKFYSNSRNSDLFLVRTERVKFTTYDSMELIFKPYKLIFSSGEIWSFELVTNKNHAKLYPTIERTMNGNFPTLLDERGIIRDRKKRKEEFKKEYYTFYEKE